MSKIDRQISLEPAKWIWFPSGRTLPNTFVKFKKNFSIQKRVTRAKGYILASSRYICFVNGERVQWGPAPADPRWEEADCFDVTERLHIGENELAFTVCYFGNGDGTWVGGNPGLIFKLEIQYDNGDSELIISDKDTVSAIDKSHPAGQHKRWFLRALQEVYDATKENDIRYTPSMELPGRPDKPSMFNGYGDYLHDFSPGEAEKCYIRYREIPVLKEEFLKGKLSERGTVLWKRDPEDWFSFRVPDSFEISEGLDLQESGQEYIVEMPEGRAAFLTFVLPEQGVGFIDFEIEAPEGTIVEAMVQESHDKACTLWLDTYFYSWTRFICKEGYNHFRSFDTESFLYLQLHIRNAKGKVRLKNVGELRRTYPTQKPAVLSVADKKIQKVFDAAINTLRNSAIETFTDGMARERQQYSGDGSHQVMGFAYLYGAKEPIVRRYFETLTDGITSDGYFMDCWPGSDRMERIAQCQMGQTIWPPILDHTFQLIEYTHLYWFWTSDEYILQKTYKSYLRFFDFVCGMIEDDGLLPVEGMKKVSVWIDHVTFKKQRDKRCVYNLYFAGSMRDHLAPICEHFHDFDKAKQIRETTRSIIENTIKTYYDKERGTFIDNLPFAAQDGYITVSDRTLATDIVYDISGNYEQSRKILLEKPAFLTKSYPANMPWVYRALAKLGEADAVSEDLKTRWFNMLSVQVNNTLQEEFIAKTDTVYEMSHCPLAPILVPYEVYAGLLCEKSGFEEFSICPNFGSLCRIVFEARTPGGDILFEYENGKLKVSFPETMQGYLRAKDGTKRLLTSGKELVL